MNIPMMATDNLNKTIAEVFEEKYIVPLYQRNFAWGKDEIERLLQDVYENFTSDKDSNYYIGSLIVVRRPDNMLEVIDGQQRLTVLSLLTKKLGLSNRSQLMYDSRPEVESFFNAVYNNEDMYALKVCDKVYHLINAIEAIDQSNLCDNNKKKGDGIITIDSLADDEKKEFADYFQNKVILIRTEIPDDTDVASYFEIMNNRGKQLQKHEIVKSLLISRMEKKEDQDLFAVIWDACSQMDIPIQKLFKAERRREFFGNDFSEYIDWRNREKTPISSKDNDAPTLKEILSPEFRREDAERLNNESDEIDAEDGLGQRAIIDFPNFLMHVFKLFARKHNIADYSEIPLNEKYLLKEYNRMKTEIDPLEFIDCLLYYRTVFDRYIVRAIDDSNQEDRYKWILKKPKCYERNNSKWTSYDVNTFDNDLPDYLQDFLIKALSMLQVRFRNRVYKEWLYDALYWIAENYDSDINKVDGKKYLSFVHGLMLKHYDANFDVNMEDKWAFESLGQNTPHFIFFFIDYLYWVAWKKKVDGIRDIERVEDFNFKYWNSVEHHLPQSYMENRYDKDIIHNLGNLCLVSKNVNSGMNDDSPVGKASRSGKYYKKELSPKRKIMYDLTNKAANWEGDQIKGHYESVMQLLEQRKSILDILDIPDTLE